MVIKISQNEINTELDRYLGSRVKRSPSKKRKTKSEIVISDSDFEKENMEFYEGKEPFYKKILR